MIINPPYIAANAQAIIMNRPFISPVIRRDADSVKYPIPIIDEVNINKAVR